MAAIMAEKPVSELRWYNPRPKPHVQFGLVPHMRTGNLFTGDAAEVVIRQLEELACAIYLLLMSVFKREVSHEALRVHQIVPHDLSLEFFSKRVIVFGIILFCGETNTSKDL